MIAAENIGRRNCIPILYTAGTHYDIGFDTVSFIFLFIKNISNPRAVRASIIWNCIFNDSEDSFIIQKSVLVCVNFAVDQNVVNKIF